MEFNAKKSFGNGKECKKTHLDVKVRTKYCINRKEEKIWGVVIQDNLSPEKHIDIIFGDTFMILRSTRMAFHFLDKDMMKIIITSIIRRKLEYAEVIWSPHKKKHVLNWKEYRE